MTWWKGLSERERLLISVMLVLLAVFAFTMLIVRPLMNYNTTASRNLTAAQNLSQMVDRAASASAMQATTELSADNLRSIITRTAQQSGLRWINIRTNQEDQTLTISFAAAPAGDFFVWLEELQAQHRIVVQNARLNDTRSNDGTIDASITFVQSG